MPENKDFSWLRRTLCEEIESVRAGASDHNRAKSVAGLAIAALKSIEVEAMLRQQQQDFAGTEHAELGTLPLCAPDVPELEDGAATDTPDPEQDESQAAKADRPRVTSPIVPSGPRFVPGRDASGGR